MTEAVDADAAAYDAVVAAHRLPKTTDGERSARTAAIERAFRVATDVPLTVVRLSARALDQARIIAPISHVPAASDLLSGVLLLNAGLTGAAANIEANVAALADTAYVRAVREEVGRLSPASPIEEVKALLSADDR